MEAQAKPAEAAAAVTAMGTGLYRKNVMKTLSVKPAKLGLAVTSRNTERTNVQHAIWGLTTEALEFQKSMRPFLEGQQLSKIDKFGADGPSIELGDIAYYLQVLGKVLKVKAVSDKKKIKLKQGSTLTQRIFDFMDLVEQIADLGKKTFYGPKMIEVEKQVRNPATKEISTKMVGVLDKVAEGEAWVSRRDKIIALLTPLQELHAELCLAILGTTTGVVMLSNIKKLELRYGEGVFDYAAAEAKDPEAEAKAAAPAAVAA
jgi:hypothetical protein